MAVGALCRSRVVEQRGKRGLRGRVTQGEPADELEGIVDRPAGASQRGAVVGSGGEMLLLLDALLLGFCGLAGRRRVPMPGDCLGIVSTRGGRPEYAGAGEPAPEPIGCTHA
ncbi:hypothetical protein [Streptomyces subrutilus]|uniref:hypothetical protein n=1 Tax=Streptomyces subrutilus TaxID=36818 RepID=UPI0033F0D9DC